MTDTEISDHADITMSKTMELQTDINDSPNDPFEIDEATGSTDTGSASFSW
jgi:hypothetical protein